MMKKKTSRNKIKSYKISHRRMKHKIFGSFDAIICFTLFLYIQSFIYNFLCTEFAKSAGKFIFIVLGFFSLLIDEKQNNNRNARQPFFSLVYLDKTSFMD